MNFFCFCDKYIIQIKNISMAAKTTKTSTSILFKKRFKKRLKRHAKKSSSAKGSKMYKKAYKGQGR